MHNIGSLEELILLHVLNLDNRAYAVSIAEEYKKSSGNGISIPAIHTVLKRLEKKGFVSSAFGGASAERGGRRKRLYKITRHGYKVLTELQQYRESLWKGTVRPSFN